MQANISKEHPLCVEYKWVFFFLFPQLTSNSLLCNQNRWMEQTSVLSHQLPRKASVNLFRPIISIKQFAISNLYSDDWNILEEKQIIKRRLFLFSMCQLIVSEKRSTIKHSSGLKMSDLSGLIHTPVKTSNDYYTISDILTNGQQLHGEIISIMAVVKSVS